MDGIKNLINTMRCLRDPDQGCPWDRKQTFQSLLPYFFEELHEYQETVLSKSPQDPHFQEELGDLLFQVVFHAQILDEMGLTNLDLVANQVAEKLKRRHPHVFDPHGPRYSDAEAVERQWELRKQAQSSSVESISKNLSKIPPSMGALARAQRLGEKAASLFGFDWETPERVLEKVYEELKEIHEAPNPAEAEQELGDLIFALSQYARKRGWNAETAVAGCNQRFVERIRLMEKEAEKTGEQLKAMPLPELERLWQKVKKLSADSGQI